MKTKKKSRFLTFCFSATPGAAEMYMGFLKTGLSLMIIFAASIVIAGSLRIGILSLLAIVIWFYSFFHANHLASLNDDEFDEVRDEYLLGIDYLPGIEKFVEKYHQWVAYILIFTGVALLWDMVGNFLYDILPQEYRFICSIMWRFSDYVPRIIISFAIIFAGLKMMGGKKLEAGTEKTERSPEEKEAEKETAMYGLDVREDK